MADIGTKQAPAGPDLTEAFRSPVSRPPSAWQKGFDVAFKHIAYAFGAGVVLLLAGVVFEVMRHAKTGDRDYGLGFLDELDLGRQSRAVRHPGRDRGHALHVAPGARHRRLPGRHGGFGAEPRLRASPRRAGDEERHRALGGDPQRGLRPVGDLRARARRARSRGLAQRALRLDSVLFYALERSRDLAGVARAFDHDFADRDGHLARGDGRGAQALGRGGLRPRRHALGGDLQGHAADRRRRHLRRARARLRPRARRDDGAGDAGGQRQRLRSVAVLARQHAGRVARQSLSRSRARSRSAR